jgi:4-amino-4-deoxy-L-arabinose transferase-like glycosyltransferase
MILKNRFNEKIFIIIIFLGSFFIRVLYLSLNIQYIYNNILVNPDSHNYLTIAKNLISGNGFSFTPPYLTSFVEPIYPIFLSFVYLIFGNSFIFPILFQILLDSLSAVLIYFFTKKLINIEVAILSSIIYLIYPDFIFATCEIMTETLSLFFMILAIYLLIKAEDNKGNLFYVFAGIMWGVSVLTKGMLVPFPFLLLFYFLSKRNFKKYFLFISFFFISLSPWIIRNYIAHKSFIIVGTRAGISFWMANNKKANGRWVPISEEIIIKEFGRRPSEVELNRFGYKKGFEYLKSLSFKELLILEFKKFLFLWDFRNEGGNIVYWYVFLLPFALIGIFINFYKFERNSILYYIIFVPIIVCSIFGSHIRLRIPAIPYLNIFSAIGINYLRLKLKSILIFLKINFKC